jgi:cytochrome c553
MRMTTLCAVALQLSIALPTAAAPAGLPVEQRLSACLSCHGEDGRSH